MDPPLRLEGGTGRWLRFEVSHPCRKNKGTARMGHPGSVERIEGALWLHGSRRRVWRGLPGTKGGGGGGRRPRLCGADRGRAVASWQQAQGVAGFAGHGWRGEGQRECRPVV